MVHVQLPYNDIFKRLLGLIYLLLIAVFWDIYYFLFLSLLLMYGHIRAHGLDSDCFLLVFC